MSGVMLFVDFWNVQIGWNRHFSAEKQAGKPLPINWRDLPKVAIGALPAILGDAAPLAYRGTRVYASAYPDRLGKDDPLRKYFRDFLSKVEGYKVDVKDRARAVQPCPECSHGNGRPADPASSRHIVFKGMVCGLFEAAISNSFDVAILISNDPDLAQSVSVIQDRLNKQIIHMGFHSGDLELRTACWGHVPLDEAICEKLGGSRAERSMSAEPVGQGRRVLLVDDDPDILRVTSAMLARAGFDVTVAPGGDDALELLAQGRGFDAMVTDYAMVGLSGGTFIRLALEQVPGLPVLVVTGYPNNTDLDRLPARIRSLPKPFLSGDLIEAVEALMGQTAKRLSLSTRV